MAGYAGAASPADRRAKSRRRWFFHSALVVVTLGATVTPGGSSDARPGRAMAEGALARQDLGEAVRLAEAQRPREALAYLARSVRTEPSNVVGRSLLLDILLRRNWPLPVAWMPGAGAPIGAQYSPDGERVVTASRDSTARLSDARTGEPVGEPMKHEGPVDSAGFSPDGARIVTASRGGTARLWDVRAGRAFHKPMKHRGRVFFAQFSPDGERVVTASMDSTARLWDARTDESFGRPMKHDSLVISAQFSPDGERVVTASFDGTARLWDGRTGKPLGRPMKHGGRVRTAQFSPDGEQIGRASCRERV